MDHKEKLDELHKASLQKLDEYLKAKGELKQEDHEKVHAAKDEWTNAWNKMMEALMVLERLEI
jgi:hypothetical protein